MTPKPNVSLLVRQINRQKPKLRVPSVSQIQSASLPSSAVEHQLQPAFSRPPFPVAPTVTQQAPPAIPRAAPARATSGLKADPHLFFCSSRSTYSSLSLSCVAESLLQPPLPLRPYLQWITKVFLPSTPTTALSAPAFNSSRRS